jgi:hypothetical protein
MQWPGRKVEPSHVHTALKQSPLTPDTLAKRASLPWTQSVFALRAKAASARDKRQDAQLPNALGYAEVRHPVEYRIAAGDDCRLYRRRNSLIEQTAQMSGCEVERRAADECVVPRTVTVQAHLNVRVCQAQRGQ